MECNARSVFSLMCCTYTPCRPVALGKAGQGGHATHRERGERGAHGEHGIVLAGNTRAVTHRDAYDDASASHFDNGFKLDYF